MKCPECEHGSLSHVMKEWVEQTGERCSAARWDTEELVAMIQPVYRPLEEDECPF